jgi:hypothetical protein
MPRIRIITTPSNRNTSGSTGKIRRIKARAKVANKKLTEIPVTIPKGLRCPPLTPDDKIMGSSGQMHGAKIVTSPERNAKK